jgi:hypothetical protein
MHSYRETGREKNNVYVYERERMRYSYRETGREKKNVCVFERERNVREKKYILQRTVTV